MRTPRRSWLAAALLLIALPASAAAQEMRPELAPLARLVGGSWHFGADTYHTFTWGVGRQSVISKSYFVLPDGDKLVSEGTFFYHPGEGTLKAYAVAIDMGLDYFEYTIEARGDTLVMGLEVFGPEAGDKPLREVWVFTGDDHYIWTLFQEEEGGWERWMGGLYERRSGN